MQAKYRITTEETMCFGDSLNDVSMMQQALFSMAMDNADPELKTYCNYEIGSSEDQAVLDILEQVLTEADLSFLDAYKK